MSVYRRSFVALLIGLSSLGATCVSINDVGVFSINVQNVTGTWNVSQGTLLFGNPPGSNSCTTVNAASYIDQNFNVISAARLVDILVKTNGSFAGNVTNGLLTVNGTALLRYAGSWNAFNTQQSLLTSTLLTRDPTGVAVLINAIVNQQNVTLCGSGAFTQAATAGLSISVQVFAQVDVTP